MKKAIIMSSVLAMMYLTASALGWGWETGHLIVTFTDKETGRPITNATVTVETLIHLGFGAGGSPGDYERTSAMTDSNGVADVQFRFKVPDFDWWVSAPSHYRREFGFQKECFRANIVPSDYEDIDPFAPDHAAKEQEMKAIIESGDWQALQEKLEPKSVTYEDKVIRRSVSFYPKHNPQPMYSYDGLMLNTQLPCETVIENRDGIDVSVYPVVDFDLQKGSYLPPYSVSRGKQVGTDSDFKVIRCSVITNGVKKFFGAIEFAPGCGAYKRQKTGDQSFPSTYLAETNAVFLSRIPYEYHSISGKIFDVQQLIEKDEYMVLRTRVVTNETGTIERCHYSKIIGEAWAGEDLFFRQSVFNPNPNDPNLEYDFNNLAGSRGGHRWP